MSYYQRAIARYQDKFGPQTTFVWVSDDAEWVKKHVGTVVNVVIVDQANRPAGVEPKLFDLALLASCDHVIFG